MKLVWMNTGEEFALIEIIKQKKITNQQEIEVNKRERQR